MNCFKCEKPLQMLPDAAHNPDGAGVFVLSFHFGSRHDQCDHRQIFPVDPTMDRVSNLISCTDEIRGYVCDDCFAAHAHLLEGWTVRTSRPTSENIL